MYDIVAGGETEQRALSAFAVAKGAGCKAIVCDPSPKPLGEKMDEELATQVMLVNRLG